MYFRKSGFTLVEVLIASMIGAFIMLVAVGALKAVSVGAKIVDDNIDIASELRFASKRICTDLINIYRDKETESTKLIGNLEREADSFACILTFYMVGRAKARGDQPEGDVYEVQYFLKKDEDNSLLMRRLWPNPDKESEPGGILSVIAEDIDAFIVRYFDGTDWQDEWPEEIESFPELVEITLTANAAKSQRPMAESFVVNISKAALESDIQGSGQQQGMQGSGQQQGMQGSGSEAGTENRQERQISR